MKQALKTYPLFLVLLSLFFVWHGYVENHEHVPITEALLLLGIYLLASLLLWLMFLKPLQNPVAAALMASSVMAFHFFFGAVQDAARSTWPQGWIHRYVFLLPLSLLSLSLLFWLLRKKGNRILKLTYFFNLLFLLLIAIDAGQWIYTNSRRPGSPTLPAGISAWPAADKPDVYLIIADEYAGDRSLKEIFHFNDSAFYRQLQERGFRTGIHSASNYNYTPYSIASTLNMDFLDLDRNGKKPLLAYCYETIGNNAFMRFLQYHGYRFFNFSYFDFPGQPSYTQETFLPNRTRLITSQTFLSRIEKELRFQLATRFNIKSETRKQAYFNKSNNEKLLDLTIQQANASSKNPRFIFTHLMLPHYPYYYDSTGRENQFETLLEGRQYDQQRYLGYLQYANRVYLNLVDSILQHATRPPVILLMSDHGFRHFEKEPDPGYFFDNLLAIHLPGNSNSALPDSLTNVNLLRSVLNLQFGQRLPLLKDARFVLDNP